MNKRFFLYIAFIIISLLFPSCLSRMIDNESKQFSDNSLKEGTFDAIIVPGYPFDGEKWDKVMKLRVVWSYYLYKEGYTKNIIYSGSAVYSPYIESRIMKEYAIALGIPEDCIYTEERAQHSTENVFLSYKLAKQMGFKRVALATDPFQNKWMFKFYKKHDCDLEYMPSQVNIVDSMNVQDPVILIDSAFVEDFINIKDRESFWQRWRGTQGKNIDFEKGVITRDS